MLLPGAEKYLNKSSRKIWTEQLANDRLILSQIDTAITFFNSPEGANGTVEYTIDTGQDRQTVKRENLSSLLATRSRLVSEIAQLERSLGLNGPAVRRIVPGY
ncbi:MAG: hypothetical protein J6T20_04895 [Treponema sp.]|nr:hypothetical protein [Treponema sp.]